MKYSNTDILNHINKIIKQEHGTRVELDNLLIDSEIDSFGYAILFLELGAINEILPNIKTISYKQDIGHTQGASGLVELCKLIEEPELNKAIGLASGLGGFYGGYNIEKYK